jgi:hypothetical protein
VSGTLKLVNYEDLDNKDTDTSLLDCKLVLFIADSFLNTEIQKLKKQYPNIVAVVSNNLTVHDLDNVKFYGTPHWLQQETTLFANLKFDAPATTKYIFTFNINKKQINRFLLLKLVEWFKLTDYCYTWSGIGCEFDMSDILDELNRLGDFQPFDNQTKSFLLSPVQLEKNFIKQSEDQEETEVSVTNYGSNVGTWQGFLNQMTYDSAISLIAESIQHEKTMTFTEKTLYSVLGLNFPIWIGGYKQASEWENYGFDAFTDVIDHGYQNYDTLIERVFYAFKLNHKLLTDLSLATQLRATHMTRLLANRQRMLDNHLKNTVTHYILQMPLEIQDLINKHRLFKM